jgi:hypothetical protein
MSDILAVRKLADYTDGERLVRYDPDTGERLLVNPATDGDEHEPWPLLGVEPIGDLPDICIVATTFIATGVADGWVELEGEKIMHVEGGTEQEPWAVTHTFVTADTVVFKFLDGDIRYEVTRQPGKYDEDVVWAYELRKEA